MDREALDEFSEQFARRLFREFPEFERHARAEDGALTVEVPPPDAPSEGALSVSTRGGEVTVGFDRYHEHFGWSDVPDDESFGLALALMREILEERQIVAVVMEGAEWRQSTLVEPGRWPAATPKQWAYLRSWRGTYTGTRGERASGSEPANPALQTTPPSRRG